MSARENASPRPFRRFRSSLVYSMLGILLLITFLPVLLMGGIYFYRAYTLMDSQIKNQLSTMVEAQSNQIAERTKAREQFLDKLAKSQRFTFPIQTALRTRTDSPSFTGVRGQVVSVFETESSIETEHSFDRLLIVTPDGNILIASKENWQNRNLTENPLLKELVGITNTLSIYDTAPIFLNLQSTNQLTTFVSKPIKNSNGEVIYTIIGITGSSAARRDLLSGQTMHSQAMAYFVTKDNYFISINPSGQDLATFTPSASQKSGLAVISDSSKEGQILTFTSADNTPVTAYAKYVPEMQGRLVVELPTAAITEPLYSLIPFTVILLAITLLVLGSITWLALREMVKPITALTEVTKNFAEGEWQQRAHVTRNDEIGLLATSFNQMADELTTLYRSLESKVEARTRQIRTAAEVAQVATSAPSLKELLRRTVTLIIERFGYYDSSIFLLDEEGNYALLSETSHQDQSVQTSRDYKLAVGSHSIIGWVTSHNQSRVASDVLVDPLYLKDDLLPDTRSEAVIPISIGDQVLGAMDVQSRDPEAFGAEDLAVLQTLANQIATAIQNIRLLEATKINLEEASLLYHASREIAQAIRSDQILQVVAKAIIQTQYKAAALRVTNDNLEIIAPEGIPVGGSTTLRLPVHPQEIDLLVKPGIPYLIADPKRTPHIPVELIDQLRLSACESLAFLPVRQGSVLSALFILGADQQGVLTPASLQPYANLAELTATALLKVVAQESMEKRLRELQTLNIVGQAVSAQTDLETLFQAIHKAISQAIGTTNFLIALYDAQDNMIRVPYMVDGDQRVNLNPFPLGSGLTSHVIRTRQPLMLDTYNEQQQRELGALLIGAPAKSWLGVPLVVGGEVIGVLAVQDLEVENRFTQDDVRLLSTLGTQIASSVNNIRLLDDTRKLAERERILHEVTSKIRSSGDIQKIMDTTVTELSKILNAKRAKIEIGAEKTNG